MMTLHSTGVAPATVGAMQEDIDDAVAAAQRAGRKIPAITIRAAALRGGPAGLPHHGVATPADTRPLSFAERCRWEIQRQSFQIIPAGSTLHVVAGDDIGTLYGVQEVLQGLLGVIWAEETLIGPSRDLPRGVQSPRIAYRGRYGGNVDRPKGNWITWMSRNRWNLYSRPASYWETQGPAWRQDLIDRTAARGIQMTLGDHSIGHYIPEDELKQHPDWMGFRDGQRTIRTTIVIPEADNLKCEVPSQLCYSNPELADTLTSRMADHMAKYPVFDILGLWPHDGLNNWCQCPACMAATPYEHMHRLALRLLDKLPAGKFVELIAYSNLLNRPRVPLPPSDRMYTMLCTYLRQYQYRIFDPGGVNPPVTGSAFPDIDRINPLDDREYGPLMQQWLDVWKAAGTVPGIFEYTGHFYDETRRIDPRDEYHPPADILDDEAGWYADRGVGVFMICGSRRGWPDGWLDYALPRSLWGTGGGWRQSQEQYYRARAGEAGPALAQALRQAADLRRHGDDPEPALQQVQAIVAGLDDPDAAQRYRLWTHYLRLLARSRRLTVAGQFEQAGAVERELQDWIEQQRPALEAFCRISALRRLSEIHVERCTQWAGRSTAAARYAL